MNSIINKHAIAYAPETLEIKGRIDGAGELFPGDGTITFEADTSAEINAFIAENGLVESTLTPQ